MLNKKELDKVKKLYQKEVKNLYISTVLKIFYGKLKCSDSDRAGNFHIYFEDLWVGDVYIRAKRHDVRFFNTTSLNFFSEARSKIQNLGYLIKELPRNGYLSWEIIKK